MSADGLASAISVVLEEDEASNEVVKTKGML
jgi:hypothetical protein